MLKPKPFQSRADMHRWKADRYLRMHPKPPGIYSVNIRSPKPTGSERWNEPFIGTLNSVIAQAFASRDPEAFWPTLRSLRESWCNTMAILAGGMLLVYREQDAEKLRDENRRMRHASVHKAIDRLRREVARSEALEARRNNTETRERPDHADA